MIPCLRLTGSTHVTASDIGIDVCPQAEQLSQRTSEVSCLEAEVGELQSRCQHLTEERDSVLGQLQARAGSLREAEHALASQQARLAQQQRRTEDAAQGSEKVPHTRMSLSIPIRVAYSIPCVQDQVGVNEVCVRKAQGWE